MFKTGLVSITFRNSGPEEIINLVAEAGLDGIEWGGDIHVPHGDIDTAFEVGRTTRDAGINVSSYGSYYRLSGTTEITFDDVLQTARALETDIIRIWAGEKGSSEADDYYWDKIAERARSCAVKASGAGIKLAVEWHGGTLTDTAEAAQKFFEKVVHDNLRTYWQPRTLMAPEECLEDMDAALPRLAGLHVFHWDQETRERLPLKEGEKLWRGYLEKAQKTPTDDAIYAMLEFVSNDDPAQFLEDAATLKKLVNIQ